MSGEEAKERALPAVLRLPMPQIRHPADLPTSDPSLATEIMAAPPPIASVMQLATKQTRPTSIYLPTVDAGSSYTGHSGGALLDGETKGKRKRRGGVGLGSKSVALNRVQRVHHTSTPAGPSSPAVAASSPLPGPSGALRSSHAPEPQAAPAINGHVETEEPPAKRAKLTLSTSKVDKKGKGKEKEGTEGPELAHPNKDHCEACGGVGEFLCCDGCPRSFHFNCLNPPVDVDDIPEGSWYCNACIWQKKPVQKPSMSLLGPLIHSVECGVPKIFKLPDPIREYFKNVATGPNGEYVQLGQTRGGRLNKFGAVEERDAYRLKDKNGKAVLCYRCHLSAVREGEEGSSQSPLNKLGNSKGRPIISCDFCSLHWHLDCLDPPLSIMPINWKKWMCPNHADHAFPQKRIPKQGVKTIDVKTRNRPNNGIIEVIPYEEEMPDMRIEHVFINGRRYRVPEKIIMLDFWDALQSTRSNTATIESSSPHSSAVPPKPTVSDLFSSPLSSLSSVPDDETISRAADYDMKDVAGEQEKEAVAQILTSLLHAPVPLTSVVRPPTANALPPKIDAAVQAAAPTREPTPSAVGGSGKLDEAVPQQGVLPAAREQLNKVLQTALSQDKAGSTPSSPKSGITVLAKGNSFMLRLPAAHPSLKRQNSTPVPHAAKAGPSTAEDAPLTPEETQKLREIKRLMAAKGEEILRFLNS